MSNNNNGRVLCFFLFLDALNSSTFNFCPVKFTLTAFCEFLRNAYQIYVTTTKINSSKNTLTLHYPGR